MSEETHANHNAALRSLARAIQLSQGDFSLLRVRCHCHRLRQSLTQQLQEEYNITAVNVCLEPQEENIFDRVVALVPQAPQVVMVFGWERLQRLDKALQAANNARDEFRKHCPFPVVFWMSDEGLNRFARVAPDSRNWAEIPIEFEISTNELVERIREVASGVFEQILAGGTWRFANAEKLQLERGSSLRSELEAIEGKLKDEGVDLVPEVAASLEFLLAAGYATEDARQRCDRSLTLFERSEIDCTLPRGCVLYHLGIWWRTYAVQHRNAYEAACERSREYFQQVVETFERAQRLDLVARFISPLGEVLQRLERWQELEPVAQRSLELHQTYPEPLQLAHDRALLADVALFKEDGEQAKQQAEASLALLAAAVPADLEWAQEYQRGFALWLLARSRLLLGEVDAAVNDLESARGATKPNYDPHLYIQILEALRQQYFHKKDYLTAFYTKQEQRSIEQQFRFRAFVGAGRLEAKREIANPALAMDDSEDALTQEIAASGRLQDVQRLVERVTRDDYRLTVIHGQSGVGKSSLVQAGLIPALRRVMVQTRDVVTVLQQVYTDWVKVLAEQLSREDEPVAPDLEAILAKLRQHEARNLLTVLIFDQFEEFFFICKDPSQRKSFYQFLRDCFEIPFVKVILSLREDYLHYLLECNERLVSLDAINNNILDKKILYYLGNFSPQDAQAVIQSLTEGTLFPLEPPLISVLAEDLARELGEVRPIEMQIVGTQLETEEITTLEQYREAGTKEDLVEQYLMEVVEDCGPENEQVAKLVLYLLTDENNTRPLKTRDDLELELEVKPETLSLVLEILVRSRLVMRVPTSPSDRYQLVHDYLVPFVRRQQSARLIAELEKEREQRKLTEKRLIQVQQKQLRSARRATFTLAGLLVAVGGFAIVATLVVINTYITTLAFASKDEQGLEQLVTAIKVGKQLKRFSFGILGDVRRWATIQLCQAVYGIREIARLEGHEDEVTDVIFSPDGEKIASISKDKTAKIWDLQGKLIANLARHTDSIRDIDFSPDSKLVATGSEDGTATIWNIDGSPIVTLKRHSDAVTGIDFDSTGKFLVTSSEDKTIKIWKMNGTLIKTIEAHTGSITSISFSPNGNMIASADSHDKIKLWTLEGELVKTIENYGTVEVKFNKDGKFIIAISKDNTIRWYGLDGTLLRKEGGSEDVVLTLRSNHSSNVLAYVSRHEPTYIELISFNRYYGGDFEGHRGSVTSLAFSPNDELLASSSKDSTVRIWKMYQEVLDSPHIRNYSNFYDSDVLFNSSGNMLIEARSDGKEGQVYVWRRDKSLYKRIDEVNLEIIEFNPLKNLFATRTSESAIDIWNIDSDRKVSLEGYEAGVKSISFGSDDRLISPFNSSGELKVWDTNGNLVRILKKPDLSTQEIIFSPDYKQFVSFDQNKQVHLWNIDGTLVKKLEKYTGEVEQVVFSPDSERIILLGNDNIASLWSSDGNHIDDLVGHEDRIWNIQFSPDSQVIASVSRERGIYYSELHRSTVKLWTRDGKTITSIDQYGTEQIEFSPNSDFVGLVNSDKTIQIWDLNGKLLTTYKGHNTRVKDLVFDSSGKVSTSVGEDEVVRVWSVVDGSEIGLIRPESSQINGTILDRDGRFIAFLDQDSQKVEIWRNDNRKIASIPCEGEVKNIEFILNSSIIVCTTEEGITSFWRVEDGTLFRTLGSEKEKFSEIRFSDDGRIAIQVRSKGGLILRDMDGNLLSDFENQQIWINGVEFSSDGHRLVSAGEDGTVKFWNIDGTLIHTARHTDAVNAASFNADNSILASASDDETIKLWSSGGELIQTIKHSGKVNRVSFSPSSDFIASANDDKTVYLWKRNGSSYKLNRKLTEHKSDVDHLTFSPNGKFLLSVGIDNDDTILWHVASGNRVKSVDLSSNDGFDFSADGKILASISGNWGQFNLYFTENIWLREAQLSIDLGVSDVGISPDSKAIAVSGSGGTMILSLDLDTLLERGCEHLQGYLKHNPSVSDRDRRLCDDILDE